MSAPTPQRKPELDFSGLWNISFGFFGIQVAFALQGANVSRIFQTLGASIESLPILWIAAPVTGLLVQPLVGHFSDRTWGRLGRRRPYFLAGAILSALALVGMPHSQALWAAALLLWLLDASINVSMEPFRAFVDDMLGAAQRTRGYAFQTVFIGSGAVLAASTPAILAALGLPNSAPAGEIPLTVRYAFYGGAAVLLFTILWTVVTTREYSPAQLAAFGEDVAQGAPSADAAPGYRQALIWIAAGAALTAAVTLGEGEGPLYLLGFGLLGFGLAQAFNRSRLPAGRDRLLNHLLADLNAMPPAMRRLALVQFLSWFGLFVLWIYATPVVTGFHYGGVVGSQLYNDGADWVGVLFGAFNGVAALYAFMIPVIAARIGGARLHALNLLAGAAGLASFALIRDPALLLVSMVGVGMAWASILTVPYALLCASLPQGKLGVYMGLFNIFIVLPQLAVSTVMGALGRRFYPDDPVYAFVVGALFMAAAALASLRLRASAADVTAR